MTKSLRSEPPQWFSDPIRVATMEEEQLTVVRQKDSMCRTDTFQERNVNRITKFTPK